ncbi:MAG: transporter substrate-binding domain-containing protein [Ignavibacteriales bacterium]|nr:MAG: transporter substrate-binding domain-containing protein [Ignavibacteriales bacterium]
MPVSKIIKNIFSVFIPLRAIAFAALSIILNLEISAQQINELVYVGDKGYPPYEYLDQSGKPAGFNVELIRAIGKILNKDVRVELMNWTDARKKIDKGSADILSMFYLPQRSENVDFGDAFTIINHQIFIRKDSPPVSALEECFGKEIILQDHAYVHDLLLSMQTDVNLILVNDEPSALKLLSSGKHDCTILGEQVGRYVINKLDLDNVTTSGPPLLPCEYRLAVKKGNTKLLMELNRGLGEIKLNGTFDKIYNKWLLIDDDPGIIKFLSRYLQYILGALLLITILILIITVHYKNKLQKSSNDLMSELEKRKKIEDELRYSQQMLDKAQKIANLSNWELDLKTNRMTWSHHIYEIFGIPEDRISAQYQDLFSAIHPEDRQKRINAQSDALTNRKPMVVEYRIVRPDGAVRNILTKGEFSYDEQNNPVRIFGTAQDITERKLLEDALKNSEERYRLLFKNNPLPMWVYNTETLRFLAVNSAAEQKYGYTREEFLSMTIEDIRPVTEVKKLREFIKKNFNDFNYAGIWQHKKKDGTVINAEIASHSINFGIEPARLILANDVTEKLIAEEELRNSKEQLRQLAANLQNIREEERTAVAREIHDELGQVLTYLKINLTLLGKNISSGDQSHHKFDFQSEIKGMTEIIDKAVKRIRKLITELRPEVLDNLGLIPALEWQIQEFSEKTGIKHSFKKAMDDLEINNQAAIAVFRIFQEALTNVVKHASATEVCVNLYSKDSKLMMDISDNGVGIDKTKLEKKKTFGLLGMKERTIILGGNFKIDSDDGKGTRLSIEVPISI